MVEQYAKKFRPADITLHDMVETPPGETRTL